MYSWIVRRVEAAGLVPRMSATEREALSAGTVFLEGGLFAGRPDFARLLREAWPQLTAEERAFLDGPVERVCGLVDEWTLHQTRELPEAVMDVLRAEGFFGLVIPKAHGGLGFSALAVSAVLGKLASRSPGLSTVVLIPNSVGPAELLHLYGTPEQKEHYLPRLARGEEIPCFALTEPEAGSDAAAMTSRGTVFRRDGRLMLRLDFEKRYITLAPIATLIGLAVKLEDPEELLGKGREVGITCVLVSADTPGVEIGRRHDPMGAPFPNGPLRGRDVVVPVEQIIGGPAYAGRGWAMLMEALASGRGISLPAQSTAGLKLMARAVGAYAAVRQQFGVPIGRIEGIEEPLARLAARAYLAEASRVFTCGAVDRGSKPAVVSAIMKLRQTELLRAAVADSMDVMGGAALCRGPRNLIAHAHMGAPIGITVEGANILTRTLIIYGQGLLRCHPYAQREMAALEKRDGRALVGAVLGHGLFFLGNVLRSVLLGDEPREAGRHSPARAARGPGPAAGLGLGQLRGLVGPRDDHARQPPQAAGQAHGPAGRLALGDVPRRLRAPPLRGRGPAGGGRAAGALRPRRVLRHHAASPRGRRRPPAGPRGWGGCCEGRRRCGPASTRSARARATRTAPPARGCSSRPPRSATA